ncbi:hypothetical protein [Chryseobacterium indoltheticum]|uniref:Uncharacterized protein n=1 Tax=Chryseobacterium indoltheticum TaxID=254 RepID=A0A381FQQ0_9FLAO|nr:hypothetical protein [Chryseobacterium indoltheticum]SUX48884.1 Uncharacterised protein [Chryseobacterium indoltheticum]
MEMRNFKNTNDEKKYFSVTNLSLFADSYKPVTQSLQTLINTGVFRVSAR